MVDKFDIRPLVDAEQDSVAALWRACDLVVSYNPPAHDIAFCRASPNSELFVAVDGDGAVVASVMTGHDGHRGWLYYVAVDPAMRGENLGRQMVAHAENWLKSLGVRKVNLMIRETNVAVRAFYESIGYCVEPRTAMARWIADEPNDRGTA
ncbi:MAG: GNAT family acetyltransferase [Proteobacteria bacterium]|nr:GNAT family acetyltransferase [Pseudomonadota bacterium]